MLNIRVHTLRPAVLVGGLAAGALAAGGLIAADAATPAPTVRPVNATAQLNLAGTNRNGSSRYRGTATGAPFGRGSMVLDARLLPANPRRGTPARINATFTLTTPRGAVTGRGTAPLRVVRGRFAFNGPVTISRGTGAYAGARAVGITFAGNATSLRNLGISLKGRVRY